MADPTNQFNLSPSMGDPVLPPVSKSSCEDLQRLELLIGSLLDSELGPSEMEELENLLAEDEQARQSYCEYMQLHSELLQHFSDELPKPPVLD